MRNEMSGRLLVDGGYHRTEPTQELEPFCRFVSLGGVVFMFGMDQGQTSKKCRQRGVDQLMPVMSVNDVGLKLRNRTPDPIHRTRYAPSLAGDLASSGPEALELLLQGTAKFDCGDGMIEFGQSADKVQYHRLGTANREGVKDMQNPASHTKVLRNRTMRMAIPESHLKSYHAPL